MSKTATPRGVVDGQAPASPQAAPATPTDWEAIERAYRAGSLTVREIARRHGISHVAIGKRIKRDGWTKDLSKRVQEAVTTKLVTKAVTSADARTDREIVDSASDTVVAVVEITRTDIRNTRAIVDALAGQLAVAIGARDELTDLIIEDTPEADGEAGAAQVRAARRRDQMLKAVSLPAHIVAVKDLTMALAKLIPLTRQAFNVPAVAIEEPPPVDETVTVTDASLDAFTAKMDKVLARAAPAGS